MITQGDLDAPLASHASAERRIAVSAQIATVRAFLAECEKGSEEMHAAYRRYFTPTTIWENVGMPTTTGAEAAVKLISKLQAVLGFHRFGAEFLAIAQSGNRVLTERIDHMYNEQGEMITVLRIMGVFDVDDGKITKWTDYFAV